MARILIIEDELAMRAALTETLVGHGYRVATESDGAAGLERACTEEFDLILLDVMMPHLDGFAVCRELRRRKREIAVLMLTARGLVDDRVTGLEAGADDYLIKPFSMKELLARIRALLRRSEHQGKSCRLLSLGEVELDFTKRTATRSDEPLALNQKEWSMLQLLAESDGKVVSREHFLDVVWGYHAYPTTRTVDNFIASLRAKIEPDDADGPHYILTVRGEGYRLKENSHSSGPGLP